jgi:hypothetical protein
MIAMQYSFVLPADYDMTIIERRIRDKGPMLDGFPHLGFKAYLSARKENNGFNSPENLYAPFYLWDEPEGLNNFLAGPGFAGLTRDFGWPAVRTWMVWHAELDRNLSGARFASREIEAVAPFSDLAARRAEAVADARAAVQEGALASVVGLDPAGLTLVRSQLWRTVPSAANGRTQLYSVEHISLPRQQ